MPLFDITPNSNDRLPGAFAFGVALDPVLPFQVDTTGKISWGNGNAAHDVSLERSSAGVLNVVGTSLNLNGVPVGGGGGGGVSIVDTGFVTSGDVSCGTSFTTLGPDLVIPAVAGDVLDLSVEALCNNTGDDLQVEAATRVAGADNRYWSTGTTSSRFPGGLPNWYVPAGFLGPRASSPYTVNADDVVAGNVTVRLYGRCSVSARTVFVNASYPLRWRLENLAQ